MKKRNQIYFKNKRSKYFLVLEGPQMSDEEKARTQQAIDCFMKSPRKMLCVFLDPQTKMKVITL